MIQALTILHILAMFIAFGLTTGAGIVLAGVAASGDVRAMRTAAKVAPPFQIAGGTVLLVGVLLGIALATTAGFGLTAKWIVIAYLITALIFAAGIWVHQPWTRRLAVAAAASADDQPSSELLAVVGDRVNRIAGPASGLLWIAIIADMVLKPT